MNLNDLRLLLMDSALDLEQEVLVCGASIEAIIQADGALILEDRVPDEPAGEVISRQYHPE